MTAEATEPYDLLRPGRTITGMSAVLLPFTDPVTPDLDGFLSHVERTAAAGLVPAINMDTGFGPTLDAATRDRLLAMARDVCDGDLVAGAHVADQPGDPFDLDAYLDEVARIQANGAVPILFPSHGMSALDDDAIVDALQAIGEHCDNFLGFELSSEFHPAGRILSLAAYHALMEIPACIGAKHSSLERQPEWDRLRLRNRVRPDFMVLTGNDLAIDMVCFGSDYLLGITTFAPDLFAERDRRWTAGDPAFHQLNDDLQYLGRFTFRRPVPAYKHSAAQFLRLRGGSRPTTRRPAHPSGPRPISPSWPSSPTDWACSPTRASFPGGQHPCERPAARLSAGQEPRRHQRTARAARGVGAGAAGRRRRRPLGRPVDAALRDRRLGGGDGHPQPLHGAADGGVGRDDDGRADRPGAPALAAVRVVRGGSGVGRRGRGGPSRRPGQPQPTGDRGSHGAGGRRPADRAAHCGRRRRRATGGGAAAHPFGSMVPTGRDARTAHRPDGRRARRACRRRCRERVLRRRAGRTGRALRRRRSVGRPGRLRLRGRQGVPRLPGSRAPDERGPSRSLRRRSARPHIVPPVHRGGDPRPCPRPGHRGPAQPLRPGPPPTGSRWSGRTRARRRSTVRVRRRRRSPGPVRSRPGDPAAR